MASGYYEKSDRKMFHDLRDGLKKHLYRRIECRVCHRPLGLINKAIYGVTIYCDKCVEIAKGRNAK